MQPVSRCEHGLLLVGPPNVGKTTVLRELSRLLSTGDDGDMLVQGLALTEREIEIRGATAACPLCRCPIQP